MMELLPTYTKHPTLICCDLLSSSYFFIFLLLISQEMKRIDRQEISIRHLTILIFAYWLMQANGPPKALSV